MKQIEMSQIHEILIDIAQKFSDFCVNNSIPYYMLGGTMLGAVRHKGFIPWDDDMDFGIPRSDYERFKRLAMKSYDENYRICTRENTPYLLSDFIKIADTHTVIRSVWDSDGIGGELGVNIDVFPLDDFSLSLKNRTLYKIMTTVLKIGQYKRLDATKRNLPKRIVAYAIKCIPFISDALVSKFCDWSVKHFSKGDYYANIYGAWGTKEIIAKSVFVPSQFFPFEQTKFAGVADADKYLKSLYGNYMSLPPEDKRHIHIENIFWK